MKTSFLVTHRVEVEHPDGSIVDPLAITEAANAGAQSLANELVIINSVSSGGKSRSAKRVTATPSKVVTCSNGHNHDFSLRPWSSEHIRPEQAIGQAD
jgi:hypothetical protein